MLYILVAIVLMAMDQRGHYIPIIRATLEYAVEPIYLLAELPAKALRGIRTYTRSYNALVEESRSQSEALMRQAGAIQRLEALQEENRRLRELLQATRERDYQFRFAELVQVNLDPFSHQVLVDRGSEDGVFVGQAVIDGSGVMGQVETVHVHLSGVRLISDPDHALPVQIVRTGQRTVAYGTGEATRLLLPNLPLQSDIRAGDTLVTSGLGDRFPPGFPVAVVERVERDASGSFARVHARPLAALDRGKEVLLVLPATDSIEHTDTEGLKGQSAASQDRDNARQAEAGDGGASP